jgi:formylmethanofuran--tetrahydromethanopterin N-formyltransferase
MDGEFIVEDTTAMSDAIGGGNFLILASGTSQALAAAEAAIDAMRQVRGAIMPFPGGVVRSGSKVGSKYKALIASTNHAFCPTLRASVESELGPDIECVLEIVIDGLTEQAVRNSMQAGLRAVCGLGATAGVRRLSAGNYGGKLGKFHFPLQALLP